MRISRPLLAAALLLSACSPTGAVDGSPDYRVEPGFLTWSGFAPSVMAPAAVTAGQPFTLRVTTFGSTCRQLAPSEVARVGMEADVTVNVRQQVGGACNRALGVLEHAVELSFPQPGTAVIRIHGQDYRPDGGPGVVPLVVERTLTVQPAS